MFFPGKLSHIPGESCRGVPIRIDLPDAVTGWGQEPDLTLEYWRRLPRRPGSIRSSYGFRDISSVDMPDGGLTSHVQFFVSVVKVNPTHSLTDRCCPDVFPVEVYNEHLRGSAVGPRATGDESISEGHNRPLALKYLRQHCDTIARTLNNAHFCSVRHCGRAMPRSNSKPPSVRMPSCALPHCTEVQGS